MMQINRREFIKYLGLGGVTGLALGSRTALGGRGAVWAAPAGELAMLFDTPKCNGCWRCYTACKKINDLPDFNSSDEFPPPLTPETWLTYVILKQDRGWQWRMTTCMHCKEAACVEICPSGAVRYHELGFVQRNPDICSGCGYCIEVCPFDIPRLRKNTFTGAAVMDKCHFCQELVFQGEVPACVKSCPRDALLFGPREDMIAEGEKRAAAIRISEKHPHASLYGVEELGGLGIIYVLNDTPEAWGFPVDPKIPATVDVHTGFKWLGAGATMLGLTSYGLNYLFAKTRRARLEKE